MPLLVNVFAFKDSQEKIVHVMAHYITITYITVIFIHEDRECPDACNNHGTCNNITGECNCFDRFYTHDCSSNEIIT